MSDESVVLHPQVVEALRVWLPQVVEKALGFQHGRVQVSLRDEVVSGMMDIVIVGEPSFDHDESVAVESWVKVNLHPVPPRLNIWERLLCDDPDETQDVGASPV